LRKRFWGRLWGGFGLPWVLGIVGLVGSAEAQTSPRHPLDRDLAAIRSHYRRLGPLAWRPTLGLLVGADSNAYPAVGTVQGWDLYASLTPGLDLVVPLGRMALVGVQGSFGYRHSFHHRVLRGMVYGGTARGAFRLGPSKLEGGLGQWVNIYAYTPELDVPLHVRDRFTYVLWEASVLRRSTLGVRAEWHTFRFEAPEGPGKQVLGTNLDRREPSVTAFFMWEGSGRTTLRWEVSRSVIGFAHRSERDVTAWDVAGSVAYRVTSFAGASVQVGYRWWIPAKPQIQKLRGWTAGLQMDLALGRRWWLLAAGERRSEWSVYAAESPGPYFIHKRLGGGVGFTLLRNVRVRAFHERYWLDYPVALPGGITGIAEQGHSWQGGLDLRVLRGRVVSLTVGYWVRQRTLPLTAPNRWTIAVGLR
jgi:hypothetical protein